jgi:hypothetical protein
MENLSMKEDSFFFIWDLSNHSFSWYALNIVGKPLMSRGASSQFHNDLTYGGEVIEYWTIFHWKFITSKQKTITESGLALTIVEKPSTSRT